MELETRHEAGGSLEIREGGRILTGRFPYGGMAIISDRLTIRKELFAQNAFDFALEQAEKKLTRIDLLDGHSFDRPLGNSLDGSAQFKHSLDEDGNLGVVFTAELPLPEAQPTYMKDLLLKVNSGLANGVSPGFRVPPKSVVPNAEELIPERGNPSVKIRRINAAVLYEMSIVTRAAYPDTSVENRMAALGLSQARRARIWL